jgi:hypothetical protein
LVEERLVENEYDEIWKHAKNHLKNEEELSKKNFINTKEKKFKR